MCGFTSFFYIKSLYIKNNGPRDDRGLLPSTKKFRAIKKSDKFCPIFTRFVK